jgi:hypothetical protein
MAERYEDIADEFILSVMQTAVDLVAAMCKAIWAMLKLVIRLPALVVAIGGLGWLWWALGRGAVIVACVSRGDGAPHLEPSRANPVSTVRYPANGLVGARHIRVPPEVAVGGVATWPCCQRRSSSVCARD